MKSSILFLLTLLFSFTSSLAQPNCQVYLMNGDTTCYEGCQAALTAITYRQGSRSSQEYFDKAIQLCPNLDYAWFEKAVPYLKRGDFVQWKLMIDQAVALNPVEHLGYRGWCRYQFLRDYEGAIRDLEALDSLISWDIGYCQNGAYHLNVAKALCYRAIGKRDTAIQMIETQLVAENYDSMLYDYLHLGVMKLEKGDASGAVEALLAQIEVNDYLAETYFYLAKAYNLQGDITAANRCLRQARQFYESGKIMKDPYSHPMDKIYEADIAALEAKGVGKN